MPKSTIWVTPQQPLAKAIKKAAVLRLLSRKLLIKPAVGCIKRVWNGENLLVLSIISIGVLTIIPRGTPAQDTSGAAHREATFTCLNDLSKKFIWNPETGHWVDITTGKAVTDAVVGEALSGATKSPINPNNAFDSQTGQNLFWDRKTKTWKDSKTGKSVTSESPREVLFCCLKRLDYIWNSETSHWVDVKTGKAVPSSEVGEALIRVEKNPGDPDRAFDKKTGRNFAWSKRKLAWIDVKTGECMCPKCPPEPKTASKIGCSDKQTNLFLGYAYSHAPDAPVKNLHGFNTSVFHNVTDNIAVGGEVSGAFGSDHVPVGTADADVKVTRYTYLFGPQFSTCPNDTVRLFGHTLIGGAHDSSRTTLGTATTDFSANALAMGFGGGVDVKVNRRVSIRAFQADYIPTRFGGHWQNNFRLSTGVVVHFGRK